MSASGVVWRQPRSGGSVNATKFRQTWKPYVSEGEALQNLYITNTGDRIGAFRTRSRSGGFFGRETFWAELENTGDNLGLLLDALMSAERVEDAANLELDDAMQDLENDDGDGLDAERVKAYEKKLLVGLDEDDSEPELSEIRKACILESYKDVGEIKKKCEEFAEKLFGPERKHVLVPNEKLAHFLWLGNYPDWCDEIMRTFRSYSHRRLNGRLLAHVRKFLKKEGRLESMLRNAYPDLNGDEIKILLKQEKKKKKKGEKGKKSPSLIHIDHFLAQLSDCTFNFVVMLNFANILFGATNRFLAKNLYVGRDVAKQIREVAVETLNGVRAVKAAYD